MSEFPPEDEYFPPPNDDDVPFFPEDEHMSSSSLFDENEPYATPQRQTGFSSRRRKSRNVDDEDLIDEIIDTIRAVFASRHNSPGTEMVDIIKYVASSASVLEKLDKSYIRTFKRVCEVLMASAKDNIDADMDFFNIPDLEATSGRVQAEIEFMTNKITANETPTNPTGIWRALCDKIQRISSKSQALNFISALDEDAPEDELMNLYAKLSPPTTKRATINASFSKTAHEWEAQDAEDAAARSPYRISSGYPTWDFAFTAKDAKGEELEPRGCFAPGEFHGLAAPTGNGKSAMSRRLVTAAAEDLVTGWGHEHARVLVAITEEAPKIVYRAAALGEGQAFHHLAKNVVIADVGASRRRFMHAVWDLVVEAYHRSKELGINIADAGLPEMILLDYIGGIVEQGEDPDKTAVENTANLIMRGLCGWRIQEMEQFSGESFSAYAGMTWPDCGSFKPVVLAFVQTTKPKKEFYDPEDCSVADFVVESSDGSPGWTVKPGDFHVPGRGAVRGSGVLQNHLTSLVMLHRSRPQNNPTKLDPTTNKMRLVDDRARLILLKTRNGSDMPFIPMRFDSNFEGLRGQFYDLLAERAIAKNMLELLPSYVNPGDPIMPPRPTRSPFTGVTY